MQQTTDNVLKPYSESSQGTSLEGWFRTYPGWSNRMVRGLSGNGRQERPQDVLGTHICCLHIDYLYPNTMSIFSVS